MLVADTMQAVSERVSRWPERAASPLVLAALGVAYLALWSLSPKELLITDPWRYAQYAHQISTGAFSASPDAHIFAHRVGVSAPVAVFYWLFGVGPVTTHLWPLCTALITIVAIWYALPHGAARPLGAGLFAFNPLIVQESTRLYPDLIVGAFTTLSLVLLARRASVLPRGAARAWLPVLAVLALFVAFLAKLTAYFVLPVWLACLAQDCAPARRALLLRFHLPALLAGVLLASGFLWWSERLWGDPLARLSAVQALAPHHSWNLEPGALRARLTTGPLALVLSLLSPACVVAASALVVRDGRTRFWSVACGLMLLCWWFGPTSLESYQPLPLMARVLVPLLPPLCVLAAPILGALLAGEHARPVAVIVLCAAAAAYAGSVAAVTDPGWFVALAALAGLAALGRLRARWSPWARLSVAAIALTAQVPRELARSAPQELLAERAAMRFVSAELERHGRLVLLTSESRSARSLAYYFGFEYPPGLEVVALRKAVKRGLSFGKRRVLLYDNRARASFVHRTYGQRLAYDELQQRRDGPPLFERDPIRIFAARR